MWQLLNDDDPGLEVITLDSDIVCAFANCSTLKRLEYLFEFQFLHL